MWKYRALTDEGVQAVLHKIVGRTLTMLRARGALIEGQDSMYVADDYGESHVMIVSQLRSCRP